MSPTILLVGCGNMGSALLLGWLDRGIAQSSIRVVEPNPDSAAVALSRGLSVAADARDLASKESADIIVLAVKPQRVDAVLGDYVHFAAAGSAILSIAAGTTIRRLQAGLSRDAAVIRAMPNTPACIGRGITVACASPAANGRQRELCETLLAAVGSVLWVEDEQLLDAVTAVSGSGPAYVFLLAECLARAGEEAGLPPELAERLARETIGGAGELLVSSQLPADALRGNVTSPGGTTAAALAVLTADDGLLPLLRRAVAAATRRSREMAG